MPRAFPPSPFRLLTPPLILAFWLVAAGPAAALSCTAQVTDINFGSVSLRAGATSQTSGNVTISCTGAVGVLVNACLQFGPGSGGEAAGGSPHYMIGGGNSLPFVFSAQGTTPASQIFVSMPVVLGEASQTVTLGATIPSGVTAVPTGSYASTFSGTGDASLTYGTLSSCGGLGTVSQVPDFTVSAQVVPSCEVDVGSLDFGNIPAVLNAPVDAQAPISVRCSDNTPYSIALGPGNGPGVTGPTNRAMTNGLMTLRYGLYRDSGRSLPWGDTSGNIVAATGQGTTQAYTVYGRVFAGQTPTIGVYGDSVVVTVNY